MSSENGSESRDDGDSRQEAEETRTDGSPAPSAAAHLESREEVLARHRKEVKELQKKEMALKKAAAKGSKAEQKAKKKAAEEEVERLEKKMKARHAKELAAVGGDVGTAAAAAAAAAKGDELDALVRAVAGVGMGRAGGEVRVTRAQKRREKRSQAEAEREQRIEEEQSNVESKKVVEDRRLAAKLDPLGLMVREVKPDGHCLYRAVEDQLRLEAGGGVGGRVMDYLGLRAAAARYMRLHSEDFLPFVVAELAAGESEENRGGGREGEDEGEEDVSVKFERYCEEVESSAVWGGQLELQALAKALKRHISVISADLPDVDMGLEFAAAAGEEGGAPVVRVSYHKHAFGLGEHYNSVVPKPKEEDEVEREESLD